MQASCSKPLLNLFFSIFQQTEQTFSLVLSVSHRELIYSPPQKQKLSPFCISYLNYDPSEYPNVQAREVRPILDPYSFSAIKCHSFPNPADLSLVISQICLLLVSLCHCLTSDLILTASIYSLSPCSVHALLGTSPLGHQSIYAKCKSDPVNELLEINQKLFITHKIK